MRYSHRTIHKIWISIATVAFAGTAFGDINNQTVILQSNTTLNLDSGATVASGGDLSWTGTGLAPQGSAKAYASGNQGDSGYTLTNQSTAKALLALATTAA